MEDIRLGRMNCNRTGGCTFGNTCKRPLTVHSRSVVSETNSLECILLDNPYIVIWANEKKPPGTGKSRTDERIKINWKLVFS